MLIESPIPREIGIIHFIGIGGIGMSGMALILHKMGYNVQGSDLSSSYITDSLEKEKIKLFFSQAGENIAGASLVVRSTAVKDNNPEVIAAREKGIPVISRSDMLAELMRFKRAIAISGTHGKTTTTSLVAKILEVAGLDPTVVNGGVINHLGSNAYSGTGEYLVVEADESDGTFIKVPSYACVVTNIDPEHMDYYGTFDKVKAAYHQFIEYLPFYGFAVLCFDHAVVREVAAKVTDRRIISYGLNPGADLVATNIKTYEEGTVFDVQLSAKLTERLRLSYNKIEGVKLSIHGRHNVQNALAAIAIALELKITQEQIKGAFQDFKGVKRRFITTGKVDGIRIVDDYAHHPVEIAATLAAARDVLDGTGGKLVVVVQPHRYSRLQDLMEGFAESVDAADYALVSEVYAAGEQPIAGVDAQALISKIKSRGKVTVDFLGDQSLLASKISDIANPGDLVVLVGAGSVSKWAYALPEELKKLRA